MHNCNKVSHVSAAAFSLTALVLLAGCTSATPSDTDANSESLDTMEPVTFVVSEPLPPTSSNNGGTNLFMEYVTERTDGRVTFEVYDTGTLHPMQEAISGVESGLSDITLYMPGLFSNDLPAGAWANGLAAFTPGSPQDMIAGTVATMAVYQSGPVAADLARNSAVYLGGFTSDSYSLLCTQPVETLDDSRGLLARSTGGVYGGEAESIGMVPVLMDANEVFEGLQRGTLDCQIGSLQTFLNDGLAEVAKFYAPLLFSPNTGAGYIMNKEKYDALPDEVKAIFAEAAPLFGIGNDRRIMERYVEWYTESVEELDITVTSPDEELVQTLKDYRESVGEKLPDTAPASVSDPQAVIDLFREVYTDWVAIMADEFGVELDDGSVEAYQYAVDEFDWDRYRQRAVEYLAQLDE